MNKLDLVTTFNLETVFDSSLSFEEAEAMFEPPTTNFVIYDCDGKELWTGTKCKCDSFMSDDILFESLRNEAVLAKETFKAAEPLEFWERIEEVRRKSNEKKNTLGVRS